MIEIPLSVPLSERSRQVLRLAAEEASLSGCDHVGTEHILLGILIEGGGLAAGILESSGVSLSKVRAIMGLLKENANDN